MQDEHFRARGLFDREVEDGAAGRTISALPLPLAPGFLRPETRLGYPALGEADGKGEARGACGRGWGRGSGAPRR